MDFEPKFRIAFDFLISEVELKRFVAGNEAALIAQDSLQLTIGHYRVDIAVEQEEIVAFR